MPPARSQPPRIAVIVARLGPYHVARLEALSARIGRENCIAIEVATGTRDYGWYPVPTSAFWRETLFHGRDYEEVSSRELKRAMVACLERLRPTVVAINGWGFSEARAAARWCAGNHVASILMSDSQKRDSVRLWPKEQVKRWIVRTLDAAVVAGLPHARYVEELGMPPERIVKGYDVVDNEHFWRGAERARAESQVVRAALGLPREYFLCCSRFVDKKGLPSLLKAYAKYRQGCSQPWDLVLVGDGPRRRKLERCCRKLGIEQSAHLRGFEQYAELPAYYGLARAFVLPSLSDQWGLVVNEAMAAGLPVIVSDACGCASELVNDGQNGFVFPAGRVDLLSAALKRMSSPNAPLEYMSRRSREIIQGWTPERFASAIQRAAGIALERRRDRDARRPRVALVTNMVPPYRVPVFRHLGTKLGDDFLVIAMSRREKNRDWDEQRGDGFRLRILRGLQTYVFAWDWAVHVNWGIHAELRRHKADVVIIGGWDTPAAWQALWAAKRSGAKIVVWSGSHVFSARSQRGPVAWLKRAFVSQADAFFAYGTLAAEYLVSLGAERARIVTGRNAVDTGSFAPMPAARERWRATLGAGEKVVVLYSGQLIKRKGVETLIRAMSRTPASSVLWIVGSGPMRAEYEELALASVPGRAVFLGHRSYEDMVGVYSASDICVLPSQVEVWGLVVNEAMAAGLPIVASATAGATPDLVQENVTGLSFDPARIDALVDALNHLIADADERRRLGDHGRALIAKYDTVQYAEDMYRSVVLAVGPRDAQ
jgi:glycosyltransferase involved in cell wall biosynthesis